MSTTKKKPSKVQDAVMCMRREYSPLIIISFISAAEPTLDLFLPGAFEKVSKQFQYAWLKCFAHGNIASSFFMQVFFIYTYLL